MRRNKFAWNVLNVLPVVLAAIHLLLCASTELFSTGHEGSWKWFLVIISDMPSSVVAYPVVSVVPPVIGYSIIGTAWWYLIGRLPRESMNNRISRTFSAIAALIPGAVGVFGLVMLYQNLAVGIAEPQVLCVGALGIGALVASGYLIIFALGFGRIPAAPAK